MEVTKTKSGEVLDGTGIVDLVENKELFGRFVDRKFQELDRDRDERLSVKELEPVVEDIGAALGLPVQGSSPDSDVIYKEVMNEFTHGKQKKVSKNEFKQVLSDVLLGMAAGLKRDPVVILRIDDRDLFDFLNSSSFEPEALSIFSEIESDCQSLNDCILMALKQFTVDRGMPPVSDSWVWDEFIRPSLQFYDSHEQGSSFSPEMFLQEFRKVVEKITMKLKECPVVVAHSENIFDGSGIRRLLSNKFELDKLLNRVWTDLPRDHHGKLIRKGYVHAALDAIAPSAGLPPYGAIDQMDKVVDEALHQILQAQNKKNLQEGEFMRVMTTILGSIMLQLEGMPISVSSDSVIHESLPSSSSLLPPLAKDPSGTSRLNQI